VSGSWLLDTGCSLLASGCWLLGCMLLANGGWLVVADFCVAAETSVLGIMSQNRRTAEDESEYENENDKRT
jgi:hypothetical protein